MAMLKHRAILREKARRRSWLRSAVAGCRCGIFRICKYADLKWQAGREIGEPVTFTDGTVKFCQKNKHGAIEISSAENIEIDDANEIVRNSSLEFQV
jgi:hypothetical protein